MLFVGKAFLINENILLPTFSKSNYLTCPTNKYSKRYLYFVRSEIYLLIPSNNSDAKCFVLPIIGVDHVSNLLKINSVTAIGIFRLSIRTWQHDLRFFKIFGILIKFLYFSKSLKCIFYASSINIKFMFRPRSTNLTIQHLIQNHYS